MAKADKGQKTSYARSVKSLQENVTRAAPAMAEGTERRTVTFQ